MEWQLFKRLYIPSNMDRIAGDIFPFEVAPLATDRLLRLWENRAEVIIVIDFSN